MASWNEILDRFGHMPSQYDLVRREYLKQLSDYTGRNTILYYSAWLQKSLMLEDDAELQDKVLSIHHSTMITISSTKAAKIIENQNGVSFINTIG